MTSGKSVLWIISVLRSRHSSARTAGKIRSPKSATPVSGTFCYTYVSGKDRVRVLSAAGLEPATHALKDLLAPPNIVFSTG